MVLALLILLIAAPCVFVYGENMITCYGSVQRLSCGTGVILVSSTTYGRTDSTICATGLPLSQVTNSNCASKISTIADRCNGLNVCEVKTDLLGNPDPCYGTFKYYNTTYDCTDGKNSVTCEQSYSTLDCGGGLIQITNANYGRANSVTCVNGLANNMIQNTNCYAPTALAIVTALCNGKSKCTLEASNNVFRDPCSGTSKYLSVSYKCTPTMLESVTCEGNTSILTCGDRSLKIISANYGRTDSTTCSTGLPSQISNTNCYTNDALYKVATRCDGKSSCEVPSNNGFFYDPCPGTYKYLKIEYSCV